VNYSVPSGVFRFTNIELKRTPSGNPDACGDPELAFSYFQVSSHIGAYKSQENENPAENPFTNY